MGMRWAQHVAGVEQKYAHGVGGGKKNEIRETAWKT
jgi:hypothetical protein